MSCLYGAHSQFCLTTVVGPDDVVTIQFELTRDWEYLTLRPTPEGTIDPVDLGLGDGTAATMVETFIDWWTTATLGHKLAAIVPNPKAAIAAHQKRAPGTSTVPCADSHLALIKLISRR